MSCLSFVLCILLFDLYLTFGALNYSRVFVRFEWVSNDKVAKFIILSAPLVPVWGGKLLPHWAKLATPNTANMTGNTYKNWPPPPVSQLAKTPYRTPCPTLPLPPPLLFLALRLR